MFIYGVLILCVLIAGACIPAFMGRRALTSQERDILYTFYEDALDIDLIRINEGGPFMVVYPGLTLGNTISFPKQVYDISKQKYQALLIHEGCHVWQYQHFGLGYIPRSLWETVTQRDTYVVHYDMSQSFRDYDVEEQCEIMAEIFSRGTEQYIPYKQELFVTYK